MSWTDERVDLLSRLWLEGRSASQIATALAGGLTRNAVIGKVHRLGLAGRVKAAAPSSTDDAAEGRTVEKYESMAEVAAAPRRVASRSSVSNASAPVSAVATARIHGNTALAVAEPVEAPKPSRVQADVVVPLSLKVTIVELRESMCKWPIGDPSSPDFRYCGSPVKGTTPYCQHHGKLAYQPAQDRRRERDREMRRPMLTR